MLVYTLGNIEDNLFSTINIIGGVGDMEGECLYCFGFGIIPRASCPLSFVVVVVIITGVLTTAGVCIIIVVVGRTGSIATGPTANVRNMFCCCRGI